MFYRGLLVLATSLFSIPVTSATSWNETECMFVFTTGGYNLHLGGYKLSEPKICEYELPTLDHRSRLMFA